MNQAVYLVMNEYFGRISWKISLILLLAALLMACDLPGHTAISEFQLPDLPIGLSALKPVLYWEICGTCLEKTEAVSGDIIRITGQRHGEGDWILAVPRFRDNLVESRVAEAGLPALGWVSDLVGAAEISGNITLDMASGLAAMALRDVERDHGVWAGLNTARLLTNLRLKNLDTINVEYGKLVDGLIARDICVYDFAAKTRRAISVSLPEGDWIDGRGDLQAQLPLGGGTALLNLYLGLNYLYRNIDGAALHLSLTQNPDGNFQVVYLFHKFTNE